MITALLIAFLTMTPVSADTNTKSDNVSTLNTADNLGFTALMYAARSQDLILFDYLIEHGADVNARNNAGATAIFIAVRNGNIQAVARLIAAGADLTIKNHNGQTAYDVAVVYEKPMIAALLKRHQDAQMARM